MLVGIAVVQVVVARGGLLPFAAQPVPVGGGRFRFAAKDRYQLAVLGGEIAIALMHLAVACGHLVGEREREKKPNNMISNILRYSWANRSARWSLGSRLISHVPNQTQQSPGSNDFIAILVLIITCFGASELVV